MKAFTRTAVLLLSCLLALAPLAGCRAVSPAPSATPAPPLRPPELITYAQDDPSAPALPQIIGPDAYEQANAALSAYFREVLAALPLGISVQYSMVQTREHLAVSAVFMLPGGDILRRLPAVFVSPGGALEYPSVNLALDIAQNAAYYSDLAWLHDKHIDYLPRENYHSPATVADMLQLLVAFYEGLAGEEIDHSAINNGLVSPVMRKAAQADIYIYQPLQASADGSAEGWEACGLFAAIEMMGGWIRSAEDHLLGLSGAAATPQSVAQMAALYCRWLAIAADGKPELSLKDPAALVGALYPEEEDIDRAGLAGVLVSIYEDTLGQEIPIERSQIRQINDTDDTAAQKALSAELMSPYPSYCSFTPGLTVRRHDLPNQLAVFVDGLGRANYTAQPGNTAEAYWEFMFGQIDYGQALHMAMELYDFYYEMGYKHHNLFAVRNDRPYDFYYCQEDTGRYSAVNCMPTATAMALKWYDVSLDVSPESLRGEYPNNGWGWDIRPVMQALDSRDVAYDIVVDPTLRQMQDQLEQGYLLFCQMNEHDVAQSGHCFVIYGYEKKGDSLWFYLHDPADGGLDKYGLQANRGKRVEAHYALWIVRRFTGMYLAIPPAREAPLIMP